jgi:hypothetical protein
VIETAAAPEGSAPTASSRVWQMVLVVVSAQLAIIALGMVFFTTIGLGNEGVGSCGGG